MRITLILWVLAVQAPAWSLDLRGVEIGEPCRRAVEVELSSGSKPASGASSLRGEITIDSSGLIQVAECGSDRVFTFGVMASNHYFVLRQKYEEASQGGKRPVVVVASGSIERRGSTRRLELDSPVVSTLEPGSCALTTTSSATVEGSVRTEEGAAVAGARIKFTVLKYRFLSMPGVAEHGEVLTDAEGRYTIAVSRLYDAIDVGAPESPQCSASAPDRALLPRDLFASGKPVVQDFTCGPNNTREKTHVPLSSLQRRSQTPAAHRRMV